MRYILMTGIAILALTACSGEDAVDTGQIGDVAGNAADAAVENADDAVEEMDEAMQVRDVDGRWGMTEMACSPDNDMRDGVILISRYDILLGLDQCSITGVDQTSDGFTRFTAECEGGEGEDYSAEYLFAATADGDLVWNNNGRMETYVRCEE